MKNKITKPSAKMSTLQLSAYGGTKMTTNYIHAINPQALIKYLSNKAIGDLNITVGGQEGTNKRVWAK